MKYLHLINKIFSPDYAQVINGYFFKQQAIEENYHRQYNLNKKIDLICILGLLSLVPLFFITEIVIKIGFLLSLFLVFSSLAGLFIWSVIRENKLTTTPMNNALRNDFLIYIENNPQILKELSQLSVDNNSEILFLSTIDSILNRKIDVFDKFENLIKYYEDFMSLKHHQLNRKQFLENLNIAYTLPENKEDIFQTKAQNRLMEML